MLCWIAWIDQIRISQQKACMTDYLPWVSILVLIVIGIVFFLQLKNAARRTQATLEKTVRDEMRQGREESGKNARELREEVSAGLKSLTETLGKRLNDFGTLQTAHFESVVRQLKELSESNCEYLEKLRNTLDSQIKHLQESNEKKLDEMRKTVDEKLQTTLEKRLGESFKIVSERLEAVQRGLGEMQSLATGVGDLKKVLTNVKTRGTWGEIQLGAILEQLLTPDQYAKNVQTKPDSGERVEFAIKLPGSQPESRVWLPIDSKFPQEDYQRILEASESSDAEGVSKAIAALLRTVRNSAQDIRRKYLEPPYTTDFAIMFLPTEGLYAEVLRQPGLFEDLQQNSRIVLAGPTTLSAILNSLQMGFRTLAIGKRASEVWQVLAAVKTEFGKFGEVLDKVQRQLHAASQTIEQTGTRTRAMERKLRDVEQLPSTQAAELLELPGTDKLQDSSTEDISQG